MGAGNFIPQAETYSCVYIDKPYFEDEYQLHWEDIVDEITEIILNQAHSWKRVPQQLQHHRKYSGLCIVENNLFRIYITDYYNYYPLYIIPTDLDYPHSGKQNIQKAKILPTSIKNFQAIAAEGIELRVRSCAWTSGKYEELPDWKIE